MYSVKSVTYKDGIVVLQELLSENEVQACLSAKVSNKTVVLSSSSSPVGDLVLRQDVLGGSQGEDSSTNSERDVLEAGIAARRNDDKASSGVKLVSTNVLVQSIVSASLEVDEGGSSINDTRKAGGGNASSSISDLGDVDTPVQLNENKR